MSEHGFLKPNPVLFDLDRRKKKSFLAHELGEGSKCTNCGDKCDGFQLHYWRKVCQNCHCGKAEHNVIEEHDPGFYFVGKIFDRPLRSREEEMEFCYGEAGASSEDEENGEGRRKRSDLGGKAYVRRGRKVRFDWIPPNISHQLARRYLEHLPENKVPIAGSEGAFNRKQQLERQFPVHDIEPKECHELSPGEIQSMEDYIANVRENVVGQGVVTEIRIEVAAYPGAGTVASYPAANGGGRQPQDVHDVDFPPPPPMEMLEKLSDQFNTQAVIHNDGGRRRDNSSVSPPPLPRKPPGTSITPASPGSNDGTFFAQPYPGPKFFGVPRPYGSTSSSLDSSRNGSPSPTSSNEDPHHSPSSGVNLSRPSKFTGNSLPVPGGIHQPHRRVPALDGPSGLLPAVRESEAEVVGNCQQCKGELRQGDVAVQADRAGPNKMWHPQCFKCFTCQEILVDLLYYYENGKVFCARDYAEQAKIPRCQACDELIFAAEYTGAEGRAWHLKHFCCYECDRPLAGHKYIPIDTQPHCLLCYQQKHGKTCLTCGEYIHPESQRVSLKNDHWHAKDECFCCAVCNTSLMGRKMTRKNNLILCSSVCAKRATEMTKHRHIIGDQSTLV